LNSHFSAGLANWISSLGLKLSGAIVVTVYSLELADHLLRDCVWVTNHIGWCDAFDA